MTATSTTATEEDVTLTASASTPSEIVMNFTTDQDNITETSLSDPDDNRNSLIAITGETGSGKSLLVSKAIDLATGGKAGLSLLEQSTSSSNNQQPQQQGYKPAIVEIILDLYGPSHIDMVTKTLERYGYDSKTIMQTNIGNGTDHQHATIKLKRVLSIAKNGQRIKSICYINDESVTLKTLKAVGTPLLAIVNAPVAAAALGRPASRLAMIDAGVPSSVLTYVRHLQATYRKRKKYREELEAEISSQALSALYSNDDGSTNRADRGLELLGHWVKELDGFEGRMLALRDTLCSIAFDTDIDDNDDSEIGSLLSQLEGMDWMANSKDNEIGARGGSSNTFSSAFYIILLDLLDQIKSLDAKIVAATQARDTLTSLSAKDSAYTALDRTRKLLLDATKGIGNGKGKVASSAEKTHQLLNQVEDALLECGALLDDDEKGLLATLDDTRQKCTLSADELLEYITEWNTLARKHGISPYQLPSCHDSLKNELDGGIEAKIMLPKAKEAEKKALEELKAGCQILTKSRKAICHRISEATTQRLPLLGMSNSIFEARLRTIEIPSYGSSHLGVDEVDFYLLHNNKNLSHSTDLGGTSTSKQGSGGRLENIASSGEKARIILAIECQIPGSIRALCGTLIEAGAGVDTEFSALPVAVIYDEIDAHVGGRASVSVAQMLVDQSRSCQVISITHSPSLAALANTHICVSRVSSALEDSRVLLQASQVRDADRRKELARMASGDMASEEAELFADALLRDAAGATLERSTL
jgi:DNA repair ATPase RecN